MLRVFACITEQHDLDRVILAAIVCLLGCITAASLHERARMATGRWRWFWNISGSAAFGAGAWATHFIGMLAYLPATGLEFSLPVTVLSLLVAVGGSLAARLTGHGRPQRVAIVLSGAVLGLSVGTMHLLGVAALRPAARIELDPPTLLAALVIGTVLLIAGVWALRSHHALLSPSLGAAGILALHLTAMSGTVVTPLGGRIGIGAALSAGSLAVSIAAVTLLLLSLSLFGATLDRYLANRSAQEARRMRRFADATFEGIAFLHDGIVVDANAPLCALFGGGRDAVVGRPLGALFSLTPGSAEAVLLGAGGARRAVELLRRVLDPGHAADTVLAVRDLTDRREAEQRIQYMAHHDSLTGLANRTLFSDRLAQAMAIAERTASALALFCLDLDGFKAINDLMGHPTGDLVLIEVGRRLAGCLSEADTVARLGGDEFAIVQCFAEQPCAAAALAERLVRLLAEPFNIAGQSVCLGASIGIALYPTDAGAPEVLLRNADLALYRAKHDGRGVFRFFEQDMDRLLQRRRTMEQELRRALLQGEFRLHYQPLLDSVTLDIEGFEALVRWEHPERGRISPAEFIPVAEASGLIVALGQWVLETACAEAASWDRPHRVAVNLSPAQFKQRDLANCVRQTLMRTGLDSSRLELEITEGILIDDADRALSMLRELKVLGVRIALDDFGTGYSSLSYLRRFPFDKLKIDASFIRGLGDGGEADAIVRAIVALGRSLGLHITAEGVETADQLNRLREHQCDQVQGFLLGRPMPACDIARLALPLSEVA